MFVTWERILEGWGGGWKGVGRWVWKKLGAGGRCEGMEGYKWLERVVGEGGFGELQ